MATTYPLKRKPYCKNLLKKYDFDELTALIASGNFNDINIGDYMEVEMTTNIGTTEIPNNVTETVRWLVADIDYYLHTGNSETTAHHLVLLPEDCFKTTHRMNSSNTTAGGYVGSEMWTTTLPKYNTAIQNAFGSSHIFTYKQLLTKAIDSAASNPTNPGFVGVSNDLGWYDCKLSLMNEVLVCGHQVWGIGACEAGINKSQFEIFRQMPELMQTGLGLNGSTSSRSNYWLSSIANTNSFCSVISYGFVNSNTADYSFGVRPFFLFI